MVSRYVRYTTGPNNIGSVVAMLEATVWGKKATLLHVPYVALDQLPGVTVRLGPGLHEQQKNSLIDGKSHYNDYRISPMGNTKGCDDSLFAVVDLGRAFVAKYEDDFVWVLPRRRAVMRRHAGHDPLHTGWF